MHQDLKCLTSNDDTNTPGFQTSLPRVSATHNTRELEDLMLTHAPGY